MHRVVLLLGGNLGNVLSNFIFAIRRMEEATIEITESSSLYKTAPWGEPDQPYFLNQVVVGQTNLSPAALLKVVKKIEAEAGRVNFKENGPRVLDIDILFFDDLLSDTDPIIPHPRLHLRNFTLIPLVELMAEYRHPASGKSMEELLAACPDKGLVERVDE